MSAVRLGLIFALALLVAGVAFLPLRLALAWSGAEAAGLAARRAEGSVWAGVLQEASLGGAPLGVVEVGLDPLSLVVASPRLRFSSTGVVSGTGEAGLGRDGVSLAGAELAAPLAVVLPGLPFRGRLRLKDAAIGFRAGRCASAGGEAVIDQLGLGARGPDIPGLAIAGRLACRDGALVLPLAGEGEGVRFDGTLRVAGDGGYRLESRIRATNPTVDAALGLSGFGRTLEGFARVDHGRMGARAAS